MRTIYSHKCLRLAASSTSWTTFAQRRLPLSAERTLAHARTAAAVSFRFETATIPNNASRYEDISWYQELKTLFSERSGLVANNHRPSRRVLLQDDKVDTLYNIIVKRQKARDVEEGRKGTEPVLDLLALRMGTEGRILFARIVDEIVQRQDKAIAEDVDIDLDPGMTWPQVSLSEYSQGGSNYSRDIGQKNTSECLGRSITEELNLGPQRQLQRHGLDSGLGEIFRTLGTCIMEASKSSTESSKEIMGLVIRSLAVMHESGVIPGSVYEFVPTDDPSSLYQPPTLHLLSNTIMTVLANVAFEARFSNMDGTSSNDPLAVHRFSTQQLGPEVWLELILWTCLHGKWLQDGLQILEKLRRSEDWALICWKDILEAAEVPIHSLTAAEWNHLRSLIGSRDISQAKSSEKGHMVERTISTELVSAYVDAAATNFDVVQSGLKQSLTCFHDLQALLDRQNMGLNHTTWDSVVLQLAETHYSDVTPRHMLRLLNLAKPYGREAASTNLNPSTKTSIPDAPYIYDSSASILGLFHRLIHTCCRDGNVDAALRALNKLQAFTDRNKKRSIEAFFRGLKNASELAKESDPNQPTFVSDLYAAEYPSFFPQIPSATLSSLLRLIADAELFEFGNSMFNTADLDGPLIAKSQYSDRDLAPSIIRYATAANNKSLLKAVLDQNLLEVGILERSPDLVDAILNSQIDTQLWDGVDRTLELIDSSKKLKWHPTSLVHVGRQMLTLQSRIGLDFDTDRKSLVRSTELFRSFLTTRFDQVTNMNDSHIFGQQGQNHVELIRALFASIDSNWAEFCFTGVPTQSKTMLLIKQIDYFNGVLDGVCKSFGARAGKAFWEKWCTRFAVRNDSTETYFDEGRRVVLERLPGLGTSTATWTFQSRFLPNLSTVRIVLRQVLDEMSSAELEIQSPAAIVKSLSGSTDKTTRWIYEKLDDLVESKEDRDAELLRLVSAKLSNG